MKGHSLWSYAPYRPPMSEKMDIYICRIVPGKNFIRFWWLGCESDTYQVYYKKRSTSMFIHFSTQKECFCEIQGLEENTDYEFYVASGTRKSLTRLAKCAETVGTVVNYLHPDDDAYAFSGKYLCSPSFAAHPDGYILASMDLFNHRDAQNLTLIFRSDDNGNTWRYMCELMPCFWGKLFLWKNEIYILGCSTEFGDLLIGKTIDGGNSFSAPTVLFRGSNGKLGKGGFHKNPQNILHYNGRIYETLEWSYWDSEKLRLGKTGAMVMSCDENDDLLIPENWSFTEPKTFCPDDAPELSRLPDTLNAIEGTMVVSPQNELLNIMRFRKDGYAIVYEADKDDPEAMLSYHSLMPFDAHLSKFMIQYDKKTSKYITIGNYIYDYEKKNARNLLCLMTSDDLKEWKIASILYDWREYDHNSRGIQYAAFEIVGDDILYLARTAMNEPHNYHDANYSTFHRINNFRELL